MACIKTNMRFARDEPDAGRGRKGRYQFFSNTKSTVRKAFLFLIILTCDITYSLLLVKQHSTINVDNYIIPASQGSFSA
jgi:hypothetical protein